MTSQTDTEEAYRRGLEHGLGWAERDIENGYPTGASEIEIRAEGSLFRRIAHTEAGRRQAAYWLGLARGYREVAK